MQQRHPKLSPAINASSLIEQLPNNVGAATHARIEVLGVAVGEQQLGGSEGTALRPAQRSGVRPPLGVSCAVTAARNAWAAVKMSMRRDAVATSFAAGSPCRDRAQCSTVRLLGPVVCVVLGSGRGQGVVVVGSAGEGVGGAEDVSGVEAYWYGDVGVEVEDVEREGQVLRRVGEIEKDFVSWLLVLYSRSLCSPLSVAARSSVPSLSRHFVEFKDISHTEFTPSFFSLRREEGPNPEDPPEGPWQVDRAELESILGLWTWSLRNRPGYLSQKSKVRSTRLFKESARVELDLWRQKAMKRVRTVTLNLEPSSEHYLLQVNLKQPNPQSSLWWNDGKEFVMERRRGTGGEMSPPPSEADEIRQFYGLQDLDEPKPPSAQVSALELGSTKSLMLACAQELYKKFLDTIMRTIKHIGGQTQVNKGRGSFYLANENIERLYTAFVQSGLGSVEDAFSCIIPVLFMQNKLPSVSSALTKAREIATRHIREREWEQASNMLELALQSFCS